MTNKKEDESEKPCKRDKETETTAKREKMRVKRGRETAGWIEKRGEDKSLGGWSEGEKEKKDTAKEKVCVCVVMPRFFFQSLPLSFFPS
jgi:hypothetical protein